MTHTRGTKAAAAMTLETSAPVTVVPAQAAPVPTRAVHHVAQSSGSSDGSSPHNPISGAGRDCPRALARRPPCGQRRCDRRRFGVPRILDLPF